jgi:hypothetical protein
MNVAIEEKVPEWDPFKAFIPTVLDCAKIQEFLAIKGFRLSGQQSPVAEEIASLRYNHPALGEFVLFLETCRWHQVGKSLLPEYARAKMFCGEGYIQLRSQWRFYNSEQLV